MSDSVEYLEVWFTGHVQGVGFRYKVTEIAKEFEVCGQVRNLSDGRVYMEAEGKESEVRAFADEIADQMENFIRSFEANQATRSPQFSGFRIVY